MAKQSARGSLNLFVGNLLATALSAVSMIIIARLLGPEGYGAYALALLLPGTIQASVGLGINLGVTRYVAYHSSRNERDVAVRMMTNGTIFSLAFGSLLALLTYASAGVLSNVILHRPELTSMVQFASGLVLAQTILQSAISASLGLNSMGAVSLSNVVQSILRLLIAPALILAGLGVVGAIAGHVSSIVLAGILCFVLLARRGGSFSFSLRTFWSDVATMLRYSFPVFAGNFALTLAGQYVLVLLAEIASNSVVGYFQSATNVTSAITLTTAAIGLALFPAFASLEGRRGDTALALRYAVKYMGVIITPVIFLLAGTASPIVTLLYGAAFSSAAIYLVLISLSNLPIVGGHGIFYQYFSGIGNTRLSLAWTGANALMQAVLAPLLSIWLGLGVSGLIYSILISNGVAVVLGVYFSGSLLSAPVDVRSGVTTLVAGVAPYPVMVAIGAILPDPLATLVVDLPVYLFLYATLLPIFGAVDMDDVARLGIAIEGTGAFYPIAIRLLTYERVVLRFKAKLR